MGIKGLRQLVKQPQLSQTIVKASKIVYFLVNRPRLRHEFSSTYPMIGNPLRDSAREAINPQSSIMAKMRVGFPCD